MKKSSHLPTTPSTDTAKIEYQKDIEKIYQYFRYTTGTTLDAMLATGILRNSITYYVRDLEDLGLLKPIYIRPDRSTGRKAKHYSADRKFFSSIDKQQLNLFADGF